MNKRTTSAVPETLNLSLKDIPSVAESLAISVSMASDADALNESTYD